MADDVTYLELSESDGSHKFYEVIVRGAELSIRYGRIGDKGQLKVTSFPSADKAQAEAKKKIAEKTKKGYERAVMGVRQKRSVTRRETVVVATPSSTKQAPVIWKFESGARAFGIFVDESLCWIGNEDGKIFALDHAGQVRASFKLPDGVKCLVADEDWLYAGCDDGKVYDLSGKVPRVAYEIAEGVDIYWLDIHAGVLAVSDAGGKVTVVNHEDESQWEKKSRGTHGWMVRTDDIGVYHGHTTGVTMYDWVDGKEIWDRPTEGYVFFGWQEETMVYAATTSNKIFSFAKKDGKAGPVYKCDATVFACAAAPDGKYVFAADNSAQVYCFSADGTRLWKLGTGCGAALSVQYHKDRLFGVTTAGTFFSLDASEDAIQKAQQGVVPKAVSIQAPTKIQAEASAQLETARASDKGVIAECYREGGKLRVRIVSPGYKQGWNCQFPKDIREEGARYLIDEVKESSRGGFYRALGNIRKITG